MSFFKNLADKFDDLTVGDNKRKDEREYSGHRDFGDPQYGQGQYSTPPPQQGYSGGPPQAPEYRPPQDKPPIPRGWIPQWDQQHQRWFYVEEATGRSQWEAPGYDATRPPMPGADSRGHDSSYGGGVLSPSSYGHYDSSHGGGYGGGYGGDHGGQGGYGGYSGDNGGASYEQQKKEKGSSKSGMLLGAAGGLAVGGVGGALLADALDDSDDENRVVYAAPPPAAAPVYVPQGDESDRESLEEAREDYEQALEGAASSSASSSEQEELEEAREEYQEEYEEYYED
ncbi:ww domain-containing protein [Seiridium cupressi]